MDAGGQYQDERKQFLSESELDRKAKAKRNEFLCHGSIGYGGIGWRVIGMMFRARDVLAGALLFACSHHADAFMGSSLPSLSLRAANVMRCQAAPKRGALALKAIDTQQDKSAPTAVEEFVSNGKAMSLFAKEQLYLDCCAAYNVDGETLLTDEEYEKLKTDLTFEGSQVILMSREEIKFMVAANRYNKGKPIMSDEEFDTLRKKVRRRRRTQEQGLVGCKARGCLLQDGREVSWSLPPALAHPRPSAVAKFARLISSPTRERTPCSTLLPW
eukprot:765885-Hanusia_phi.AAC.1